MNAKHRGGRRPWRRRAPGIVVAVLAAASAAGVAGAALQGGPDPAAAVGGGGAVLTLAAGLIAWSRRHRAEHRLAHQLAHQLATAPAVASVPGATQPAVLAAMSTPPALSARPGPFADLPEPRTVPALFALPDPAPELALARDVDPMVDTVPHPVVKLFPMRELEPELASGSIDERVYAALDAQREATVTAALASGRHAAPFGSAKARDKARDKAHDAARPTAYRSRHSA